MRQGSVQGFTLFELVLGIALLGIVFSSGIIVFQEVLQNKHRNDASTRAAYLAHQELERVTQRRFSDIQDQNAGSRGQKIVFPAPYDNYSYEIIVDPVDPAGLDGTPLGSSDYHRIFVEVENASVGTVRLTSLVTRTE